MAIPQVIVEVGFTPSGWFGSFLQLDDFARGRLDTGTLGPDAVWTDISIYATDISIRRGANRVEKPIIRYEAGTATIVLRNEDRRFDPTNLSGPYVGAGVTQVTPMRAVRVTAIWAGVTYPLFHGFADEWRITYKGVLASEVVLVASDAFKVLANIDRTAGASVGASEDTGARINRILDSANWPATDRIINTGDSTVQATTLAGNALAELRLVQDTELGELFIGEQGHVIFRHRQGILGDSRSNTSQGTFGDGGGAELFYDNVDVAYDDATIANRVMITRVGGTQQQADDGASQTLNLIRTYNRTDLIMETDPAALDHASYILRLGKDPELRFATLTVMPLADPTNLFPQVLGRFIGDRLTVIRRPPGGGVITRDVFVRGISYEILKGGNEWWTTWTLESATKYQFFVLDHATLGKLDQNALGY